MSSRYAQTTLRFLALNFFLWGKKAFMHSEGEISIGTFKAFSFVKSSETKYFNLER